MTKYNFQPGDIVQHINMPTAVGIIFEQDQYTLFLDTPIFFWDILWLSHPDEKGGALRAIIGDKWIKPLRKQRKSKNKVDKQESK